MRTRVSGARCFRTDQFKGAETERIPYLVACQDCKMSQLKGGEISRLIDKTWDLHSDNKHPVIQFRKTRENIFRLKLGK